MQVELKVNDKSVQAEISEEQLKKMGLFEQLKELGLVEDKPKTGYERVEKGSTYFYNYSSDDTDNDIDKKDMVDQELLRQLRQWQALNDKSISVEDWKDNGKNKWCIIYGYGLEKLYVDYFHCIRLHNVIYFTTREKAEEAIEVFRDELIWYFVEYQQRLDEE